MKPFASEKSAARWVESHLAPGQWVNVVVAVGTRSDYQHCHLRTRVARGGLRLVTDSAVVYSPAYPAPARQAGE